jgi:hypothetical protein
MCTAMEGDRWFAEFVMMTEADARNVDRSDNRLLSGLEVVLNEPSENNAVVGYGRDAICCWILCSQVGGGGW